MAGRRKRQREEQPPAAPEPEPTLPTSEDDDHEFLDAEIDAGSSTSGSDDEGHGHIGESDSDENDDETLDAADLDLNADTLHKMAQAAFANHAAAPTSPSDDNEDSQDSQQDDEEDGWGIPSSDEDESKERIMRPEIAPETDSDDSDLEPDRQNTVGNIPMEWYNDYPHIGYDLDGKKIMKPAIGDELDKFLAKMDDPKFWTSIHDKTDQKDVELTEEELQIIQKLQSAEFAGAGYDPIQDPNVKWFTDEKEIHPVSAAPEPKRRFVPSKWEHKKVMKIVRAIRSGLIVPRKPKTAAVQYFDVWESDPSKQLDDNPMHMPAPKQKLPGHVESYNPPEEYLFTEEERKAWEEADPEDRKIDFIPQKYDSLRKVPAYPHFIQDRFQRCLDLYLCPRVRKKRVEIDPDSLIPKLPDPKDLEPFPTSLSLMFLGHTDRVRSLSTSPSGQFVLSGSDDKTMRLWEVATARCLHVWQFADAVSHVAWNPARGTPIASVVVGQDVFLVNLAAVAESLVADQQTAKHTSQFLAGEAAPLPERNSASGVRLAPKCEWRKPAAGMLAQGCVWMIHHQKPVAHTSWHRKGDYFVTVAPHAGSAAVQIHQLSRKLSQQPFKRNKGLVVQATFHHARPHLYVATQRYVRIYDLATQQLTKKLTSGVQWISSMAIHPGGDNVIVGSYDKRLCWWDLELGTKPYKTLRYHKEALRGVGFHTAYPLFASASDDGTVQVFHGCVYSDMLTNPLIVPVKVLRAHQPVQHLGVLALQWHPNQPWLFSAGADGSIKLWV